MMLKLKGSIAFFPPEKEQFFYWNMSSNDFKMCHKFDLGNISNF